MTDSDIDHLRKIFVSLDVDNSGTLSVQVRVRFEKHTDAFLLAIQNVSKISWNDLHFDISRHHDYLAQLCTRGLIAPRTMCCQEVAEGLKRLGWSEIPPDLQAIMEEVDSDKSGHIDYTGKS